eukprot:3134406-Prymnesium_polylepis.1
MLKTTSRLPARLLSHQPAAAPSDLSQSAPAQSSSVTRPRPYSITCIQTCRSIIIVSKASSTAST